METAGWFTRVCLIAALGCALASCGGADQEAQTFNQPQKGGIWHGTDPITGDELYGLACECGAFRFLAHDGTQWVAQYAGHMSIDPKTGATGTFEGFGQNGAVFNNNNEAHGTGGFGGVWEERKSMHVLVDFQADSPPNPPTLPPVSGELILTFDEAYNQLVSPAANWGSGNDTMSITGLGTLFADLQSIGCTANGSVKPASPGHNVYEVSMTLTCGVNVSNMGGLAAVDTSTATPKLVFAVSDSLEAITLTFDRI